MKYDRLVRHTCAQASVTENCQSSMDSYTDITSLACTVHTVYMCRTTCVSVGLYGSIRSNNISISDHSMIRFSVKVKVIF